MKVKNIMFSGVMAAILGATGANAAAINVASQGYVDEKVGEVSTNITNNYLTKTDAQNTYLTETQVQQEIKDVVGDSTSGVVADVAKNTAAIAALDDKYATDAALNTAKEELQGAIDAEALARGQADTALGLRVQELEKFSGNGEGSVARQIADAVAGEASLREAADAGLQGEIDAIHNETTGILAKAKEDATTKAGQALTDAKAYTNTEVGKVDAKLADYTKTSDLDKTFATDAELGAVDAKFANYTTTDALNTKLNDYATTAALTAEETARKEADQVATRALANVYTKTEADEAFDAAGSAEDALTAAKAYTNELANGQVKINKESIESINTTLGTMATSETVTALTTRVGTAESDIDALQAKDAELVADLSKKIEMPAACQNTYCVLSVNGGTVSWMPLTEPVSEFNK